MKNQKFHYSTLALLLAAALSACGGGGGSPGAVNPGAGGGSGSGSGSGTGTPAPAPATASVGVTLVGANNQPSSALSGATPLTVRAVVRDANNQPVPNAVVTFTTDANLALFAPTAGTALTDASGTASITVRSASLAAGGAGSVTATTTLPGSATTVSGSANYAVNATALSFSAVRLDSTSIDAYGSTLVSVDLMANGAKYTGQQVNVSFSSACVAAGKATLAASVATNMGTAQTVYRDAGCGNNDVITASADGVATPVAGSLAIAAPRAASVQFVEAIPNDKSIVIRGQGGINRTETATLRFRLFDIFGGVMAGKAVEFKVMPEGVVTLNKTRDSTDQRGEVVTTVSSGTQATTFRVQAIITGTATSTRPTDISTTSDSIVVTTGLPTQRAFSLSATKANVDGTFDSGPVTPASVVNILIADEFGNPVSDGTPVVFQTNIGAIGSSNSGGCLTVNGGCSVDYRVQNPRVALPNLPATPCNTGSAPGVSADSTRRGVATICASTTDGVNTQFAKTTITLSGDRLGGVYVNGSTAPSNGDTIDLGSASANDPKVFTLQLTDVNGNPLPADSTVEITGLSGANLVQITPAKVPNIFAGATAGLALNGSNHRVTLDAAVKPCTANTKASFNLLVTTPRGEISSRGFTLNFTCP